MLQATLRPKAALSSKKNDLHFLPYKRLNLKSNLTLTLNRSRSTQGHNLNNLGSTCIDNATYQVSRSSVYCFWSRRFFKVLTIYWHGGHVGHVTQLICINFHSHSPLNFFLYELWFQMAQLFLRKTSFNFEI